MRLITAGFALFVAFASSAAELPIEYSWPLLRADGSPQPQTGPFALTSVRFEIGSCVGAAQDQFGVKEGEITGMWPNVSVLAIVSPGIKCVRGFVSDASGIESPASNLGRYAPAPAPVILKTVGKIAYELRLKSDGDYYFVSVGSVPLNRTCGRKLVGVYAQVDGAQITKPLKGGVIAARCS
jgi:hypothetical protein